MNTIVIVSSHYNSTFYEPIVEIGQMKPARPLQEFSDEQLEMIPQEFRCFSCMQKRKRRDLGGIERKQRICRFCWPYVSDWAIGCMIAFDIRRGFVPIEL